MRAENSQLWCTAVEDEDELIRVWGQKVKSQVYSKSKYGQIRTLRHFSARLTMLDRAIAKGRSVCLSVCLSVRHLWSTPKQFKKSKK